MHLLAIFLVIIVIKCVLNLSRLTGTFIMLKIFRNQPKNIDQYCPFVTSLFNSAGTQQIILSTTRAYGLNQAQKDYISNSLGCQDVKTELEVIFQKTIGVYKFRLLQTINPFYWLFLPKFILEDFNVILPAAGQMLLNLFYWVLGSAGTYFFEKYLDAHFQVFFQHIIDMLP